MSKTIEASKYIQNISEYYSQSQNNVHQFDSKMVELNNLIDKTATTTL